MVLSYFLYTLAVTAASQGGRHHCECNDPEIFQTTLSARQPCSCLSHYERVIAQSDSQIHSETECRCSQKHVKWSSRKKGWFVAARWISAALVMSSLRLSKPVIQTIQTNAFSITYSYYQISTEPKLQRGNKWCIYVLRTGTWPYM